MSPNTFIILLGLLLLAVGTNAGFDIVLLGINMILGAIAGSLLAHFFSVTDWQMALLIAGVLSLIYVLYARTFIQDRLAVTSHKTNTDKLYGEKAKVMKAIAPFAAGQVMISGETWRAESSEKIAANTMVTVERIEGITLWVKPFADSKKSVETEKKK